MSERVAFARELVGRDRKVAPVARFMQITRQAIRTPNPAGHPSGALLRAG